MNALVRSSSRVARKARRLMGLADFVGALPYGPARNYGTAAVEAWRPSLTKNAGTLPVEFLLAWVAVESGGKPCDWETATIGQGSGGGIEAGIFQLMSPDNIAAGNTSLADQQPSPPCPPSSYSGSVTFSQLSDDQVQAMVAGGITYVSYAQNYVEGQLAQYGYSWDTSMPDYWSLVKMVHVAPATVGQLLQAGIDENGAPATSWAQILQTSYAQGLPTNWTSNASVVGQYGAGGGGLTNLANNALSSLLYLNAAEAVLIGIASLAGVGSALFFYRWLRKSSLHPA